MYGTPSTAAGAAGNGSCAAARASRDSASRAACACGACCSCWRRAASCTRVPGAGGPGAIMRCYKPRSYRTATGCSATGNSSHRTASQCQPAAKHRSTRTRRGIPKIHHPEIIPTLQSESGTLARSHLKAFRCRRRGHDLNTTSYLPNRKDHVSTLQHHGSHYYAKGSVKALDAVRVAGLRQSTAPCPA